MQNQQKNLETFPTVQQVWGLFAGRWVWCDFLRLHQLHSDQEIMKRLRHFKCKALYLVYRAPKRFPLLSATQTHIHTLVMVSCVVATALLGNQSYLQQRFIKFFPFCSDDNLKECLEQLIMYDLISPRAECEETGKNEWIEHLVSGFLLCRFEKNKAGSYLLPPCAVYRSSQNGKQNSPATWICHPWQRETGPTDQPADGFFYEDVWCRFSETCQLNEACGSRGEVILMLVEEV